MRRGISILEAVVGVMVMLVVGTVAAVMVLSHLKDSQVATTLEDLVAVRDAIVSAATDDQLVDADNDNDYLDDLIEQGRISKELTVIPGASYQVLQSASSDGVTIYYLSIECSTDRCREIIQELDEKVDNGDGPASGSIQWTS